MILYIDQTLLLNNTADTADTANWAESGKHQFWSKPSNLQT